MIDGGEVKDKTLHAAVTAAGGAGRGSRAGRDGTVTAGEEGARTGISPELEGKQRAKWEETGWVLQLRGKG